MLDCSRYFIDTVTRDWLSACDKLEEHHGYDAIQHLTDDEKFAIAVIGGAEWYFGGEYGTTPVTEECGITVTDGKCQLVLRMKR